MLFALGFLAGVAVCTFLAVVLTFFNVPIVRSTITMAEAIKLAGPRPKGGIYLPRDEAEAVRQDVIAKNRERGKDTPISELL